ncbi:MAG: hypothetical protein P1U55_09105, partial [Vannielia sp.]|nr:hypothetical protein [Vannielia sp.]
MEDEEAEKIWAAYPLGRLCGKAACLAQVEEAMKEEIRPDDLLQAVQAYGLCCTNRGVNGVPLSLDT